MKARFICCGMGLLVTLIVPAFSQIEEVPENPPVARPVLPENRVAEEIPEPVIEDRVVISASKQFRISGSNDRGRGICSILAENAKEELLMLLEQPDDWKIAVSIRLHGEPGGKAPPNPILTRLQVVEGVYNLHLDIHLAKGLAVERFKQAVLEMLIYERALRDLPLLEEGMELAVPPWLGVGIREACAWRMQEADRRLYAAMFKEGGTYKVDDLFAVPRSEYAQLDEASEAAFRVSAGSLVMALVEQPGGRESFREFLSEAAAFQGEMALLLRRHFPELNLSPNSLSKWWALQLANQGGLNLLTDVMTIAETEQQLSRALFLYVEMDPEAETEEPIPPQRLDLQQWSVLEDMKPEERQAAVIPAQAALVHLSYRCFPSYRPLLVEYQKQLMRLAAGEGEAVMPALQQLEQARAIMNSKSVRGRDYLDWFEITSARHTSGAFDDYLQLKQELKVRENDRKDGMSQYLDRMDALFDRSEQK